MLVVVSFFSTMLSNDLVNYIFRKNAVIIDTDYEKCTKIVGNSMVSDVKNEHKLF